MAEVVSIRAGKVWHVSLWVAQVVLAVGFAVSGVMKLFMSVPDLLDRGVFYAGAVPLLLLRFIGLSELTAAIGLILPASLRIAPKLTPLAATGLAAIMVMAIGFHITRGDPVAGFLPVTLGLFLLAVFVAWGRFVKAPIAPREKPLLRPAQA